MYIVMTLEPLVTKVHVLLSCARQSPEANGMISIQQALHLQLTRLASVLEAQDEAKAKLTGLMGLHSMHSNNMTGCWILLVSVGFCWMLTSCP